MAVLFCKGESIEEMHKQQPHCTWCGKLTLLVKEGGGIYIGVDPDGNPQYKQKHNAATRDHLFSKFKKELRQADKLRNGGRHTVVMACHQCNHKRGARDNETFLAQQEEANDSKSFQSGFESQGEYIPVSQ